MSTKNKLPDFELVSQALEGNDLHGSFAHGVLCGILCAGNKMTSDAWIEPFFCIANSQNSGDFSQKPKDGQTQLQLNRQILLSLYEATIHQLSSFDFGFEMLLPDMDEDMHHRARALSLWCKGFLEGLERVGIKTQRYSEDTRQAVFHCDEISNLDHDSIDASEDDEKAFFEVTEYVRLAALAIHHEFATPATDSFIAPASEAIH